MRDHDRNETETRDRETETETGRDALQEIARAATGTMRRDALGFWIPDKPC